jgi:fluoride exporter
VVKYIWIGLGGFLGANCRYLVQGWAADRWGSTFPYGTLLANLTGSFILAFFMTLATERITLTPEWRLFFAIGVLGGYTTFSSFSLETATLLDTSQWLWGGLNILGNVVLGLVSAFAGIALARLL